MALSFPSSPTTNQQSTQNGITYQWDGTVWRRLANLAGHASTHGSGGADAVTIDVSQVTGAQKAITSGTAAPSGGSNGDIYLRYP